MLMTDTDVDLIVGLVEFGFIQQKKEKQSAYILSNNNEPTLRRIKNNTTILHSA